MEVDFTLCISYEKRRLGQVVIYEHSEVGCGNLYLAHMFFFMTLPLNHVKIDNDYIIWV